MVKLVGLDKERKILRNAVENCRPALLVGETGTGKTSLAQDIASELNREFIRVNLDGGLTPAELVGRYQLKGKETVYELGIIPLAMKAGKVLILDEINSALADTLFCLHAIMEERPRLFIPEIAEEITPADGFSIIAIMFRTYIARDRYVLWTLLMTIVGLFTSTPIFDLFLPPAADFGRWIQSYVQAAIDVTIYEGYQIATIALLVNMILFREKLRPA